LRKRLGRLFSKVLEFVDSVLEALGPYDGVAYWVKQTFNAVQLIEKRPNATSSIALITELLAEYSTNLGFGGRAKNHPPSNEEASLSQVKVPIEDKAESKALWTTSSNIVLPMVAAGTGGAEAVGHESSQWRHTSVDKRAGWQRVIGSADKVAGGLLPPCLSME
jgi:hypothetical protein